MALLDKIFDLGVEIPVTYKDKTFSDEQRVRLGDDIKWFWKSSLYNQVIKPFTESWVVKNMSRLIEEGVNLDESQIKEIIHSARFGLALKNEIKSAEALCDIAKKRLLKKIKTV